MSPALPLGWGATEMAAHDLRVALDKWAIAQNMHRAAAVARAADRLLRELDHDAAARRQQ